MYSGKHLSRPMTDGFSTFASPPVVETVLAFGFIEPKGLNSAQIVRFWDQNLASDLPGVSEQPRYQMPIERLQDPRIAPSFGFSLGPPSPRFWFSDEGAHFVQMQADWIAYNWRRVGVPGASEYERYPAGRERFREVVEKLKSFLLTNRFGALVPAQCEVTYINHIEVAQADQADGRLGGALRAVNESPGSLLPMPEVTRLATSYLMTQEGSPIGRLHVTADPGRGPGGADVVILTLTARGRPLSPDAEGAFAFCDLGREWIVKGFLDITTDWMQRDKWGLVSDHDRY